MTMVAVNTFVLLLYFLRLIDCLYQCSISGRRRFCFVAVIVEAARPVLMMLLKSTDWLRLALHSLPSAGSYPQPSTFSSRFS